MPEIEANKIRSRFDARYWRRFFLGLVSKPEFKCQKFSVSSRSARLNQRNSHSRLEIEKMTLTSGMRWTTYNAPQVDQVSQVTLVPHGARYTVLAVKGFFDDGESEIRPNERALLYRRQTILLWHSKKFLNEKTSQELRLLSRSLSIVNHYSSMSWVKFRNLSVIVFTKLLSI